MSQSALNRALEIKPSHDLALFSAGKLCLVQGKYAPACDWIERALQAGAPEIVRFELGQAHYLLGQHDEAARQLLEARSALVDDPAQSLLLQYYLGALGAGELPTSELIRNNIQHWRQEAQKYGDTPYGAHMYKVESELRALLDNASPDLKCAETGTASAR